jgi:hypothetical protein
MISSASSFVLFSMNSSYPSIDFTTYGNLINFIYSAAVIPILSLGLSISSPYLSSDELDSFMRRMLVSRISRRVLAEHHLALSQGLAEQEQSKGEHSNVGIIFPNLSIKRSVDKFIRLLLSEDSFSDPLRQHSPLQGLKELPKIVIDGETDATFPYIREHLEYIILELLLNVSCKQKFDQRLLTLLGCIFNSTAIATST